MATVEDFFVLVAITFQNASTRQTDSLRAQTQARHYPFAPAIGQTCTRSEPTANLFATLSKGLAKRMMHAQRVRQLSSARSDASPNRPAGQGYRSSSES